MAMASIITWNELIRTSEDRLETAGIEEAAYEAEFLVMHVFNMRKVDLVLSKRDPVPESMMEKLPEYERLLSMRESRIPMSQVIGERDFMGLTFRVNDKVLTPRFETEELVELVLPFTKNANVLDLCTGSGCIAVSIAKLGVPKSVTASDLSDDALQAASKNAAFNNAAIEFIKSDLFTNIAGRFDIIVSNPPYIASKEIETLEPEVRDNEPRMALDGGEDGLMLYRRIIRELKDHLNPNGRIFFEIGSDQGDAVYRLLEEAGFRDVAIKKDLAGRDRIASGVLR